VAGHAGREEADDEETIAVGPIRTAHEIADVPLEQVSVDIPSHESIALIGEVVSQISLEQTVVVKSVRTTAPLDEGSLLCLENRVPIGIVNEVFGPLNQPFYVVKGVAPSRSRVTESHLTSPVDPAVTEEGEVGAETEAVVDVDIGPGTKIYCPIGLPLPLLPPLPPSRDAPRNDLACDCAVSICDH
jgi:rRNA processing protein Gar1